MKVTQKTIKVKDLVEDFEDIGDDGVYGYGGVLNIRPQYQREFVYKDKQRAAVIQSILSDLPINVMYWSKIGENKYEVLDGQQRTMSICQYVDGYYSINNRYFYNLPKDEQEKILNYNLIIYVCEGTESEKLEWFRIINVAGEQLTNQELLNAVYSGDFVSDAKSYFSKPNAVAQKLASDYLKGKPIRQDYLETALKWIAHREGLNVEQYMALNQHKENATDLWNYFHSVIEWVKENFVDYRNEMKHVQWGKLYNEHGDRDDLDPDELSEQIDNLMGDRDVTKKSGIYEYVLTGDEKLLHVRTFDRKDKLTKYQEQEGQCAICENEYDVSNMYADHIVPWSKGGRTTLDNCQVLCMKCNLKKSNK